MMSLNRTLIVLSLSILLINVLLVVLPKVHLFQSKQVTPISPCEESINCPNIPS